MKSPRRGLDASKSADYSNLIAAAAVFLATFAVFWPALHNGFVNFDDTQFILRGAGYWVLDWSHIRWMFSSFYEAIYAPLSWLLYAVDCRLWGLNPFGYHLTNLLIHALNAVLFYFLSLRLLFLAMPGLFFGEKRRLQCAAVFSALFFSLHPLRVGAVAWASGHVDVLAGFFYLLTIVLYLKACEEGRGRQGLGKFWYVAAVFACALSLLSKGTGIGLPLVLVILDVYPLRRLTWDARRWFSSDSSKVMAEKIPFFILALGAGIVGYWAERLSGNVYSGSISWKLAEAAYGLAFYAWKTVWPFHLVAFYARPPHMSVWREPFLACALAVAVSGAAIVAARKRWEAGPALWLFYVVALAPVLGLTQFGLQLVANRYSYLACLGWALLFGAGLGKLLAAGNNIRRMSLGAAGFILVFLGILSRRQTEIWRNSQTLWKHEIAVAPKNQVAHNNLGAALAVKGKWKKAIVQYKKAISINPNYATAQDNLGVALAFRGKMGQAIAHYERAIRIDPDFPSAFNHLGLAFAREKKYDEAITEYRRAIQINPNDAEARSNLGMALAAAGKIDEAISEYHAAIKINPKSAAAFNNLGMALTIEKKFTEAASAYRRSLRINPKYAATHYNLGVVLMDQGEVADALGQYKQAVGINPNYAAAHNDLGNALMSERKIDAALAEYEKVVAIEPGNAAARRNLGVALFYEKKFNAAVAQYKKSIAINPGSAATYSNLGLVYASQGRMPQAIDEYRRALKIKPDYIVAYYNLALALNALGRKKEALAELNRVLSINPSLAPAVARLILMMRH